MFLLINLNNIFKLKYFYSRETYTLFIWFNSPKYHLISDKYFYSLRDIKFSSLTKNRMFNNIGVIIAQEWYDTYDLVSFSPAFRWYCFHMHLHIFLIFFLSTRGPSLNFTFTATIRFLFSRLTSITTTTTPHFFSRRFL